MKPSVMSLKHLVTAAFLVILATPAQAILVIDQNQPIVGEGITNAVNNPGQTFQQTANNVAGAGFFLTGTFESESITIQLLDNSDNNGGILLASGSGTATPDSFFDVFWTPVAVAPNTTLLLRLIGTTNTGVLLTQVDESPDGPYPDGSAVNAGGGLFAIRDHTFRTYAEIDQGGAACSRADDARSAWRGSGGHRRIAASGINQL